MDETIISAMANIGSKLTVARPRRKGRPRPKHPTRNPAQNRKRIVKKDMPSTAVRSSGEQRSGIMSGMEYRDRRDKSSETKQRGNDETQDEPDMPHGMRSNETEMSCCERGRAWLRIGGLNSCKAG